MNIKSTILPHRFTETQFRRYEETIQRILVNFPSQTTFKDLKVSPETFAARLRDAIKSLRQHGWETTIDLERFDECYKDIVISIESGGVVAYSKSQRVRAPIGLMTDSDVCNLRVEPTATDEMLANLCELVSARVISVPVEVRRPMSDSLVRILETKYDVGIVRKSESVSIII